MCLKALPVASVAAAVMLRRLFGKRASKEGGDASSVPELVELGCPRCVWVTAGWQLADSAHSTQPATPRPWS